jgi:hypothetical protein
MTLRIIAALMCCVACNSAFAFEGKIHAEGKLDGNLKHRFCYTDVVVSSDGSWKAQSRFSNGTKINGEHFVAVMTLLSKDGKPLATFKHAAGVDASFGGSARVKKTDWVTGKFAPDVAEQLSGQRNYSCTKNNTRDDEKIVGAIVSAIESF